MKILILSDNHYKDLNDINYNNYDYVVHAGDYGNSLIDLELNNVIFVRGNCDSSGPIDENFEINGKKFYLTHGHYYDVKNGYERLILRGTLKNVNFVIFGHTHRPDLVLQEGIVYINPGSYQNGYYVELTDKHISFFKDGKMYKQFENRW